MNVSIDYLVGKTDFKLIKDIMQRIKDIINLPPEAKKQVFMIIDTLIRDFKTKQAYAS